MNGSVVNVVCFEWSVMNGSVLNGNRCTKIATAIR